MVPHYSEGHSKSNSELPVSSGDSVLKYAIIVAAGSGVRAGGGLPKQFREVAGLPVLWYSVYAFLKSDPETRILIALSEEGKKIWSELVEQYPDIKNTLLNSRIEITPGGKRRQDTVLNALGFVNPPHDANLKVMVAIHDAARPMISPDLISEGWKRCLSDNAVIPVIPLSDSIRKVEKITGDSRAVDRSEFVAVQTPQIFDFNLLQDAYSKIIPDGEYTDDASVVEPYYPVKMFPGEAKNFKVTCPHDFLLAEALLSSLAQKG